MPNGIVTLSAKDYFDKACQFSESSANLTAQEKKCRARGTCEWILGGDTVDELYSGGGSELMDRRECAILALKVVPKNLIFCIKILPKNLFYKILCLVFQQGKLCVTNISSKNGQ